MGVIFFKKTIDAIYGLAFAVSRAPDDNALFFVRGLYFIVKTKINDPGGGCIFLFGDLLVGFFFFTGEGSCRVLQFDAGDSQRASHDERHATLSRSDHLQQKQFQHESNSNAASRSRTRQEQ
jgi:hypothetical protein